MSMITINLATYQIREAAEAITVLASLTHEQAEKADPLVAPVAFERADSLKDLAEQFERAYDSAIVVRS